MRRDLLTLVLLGTVTMSSVRDFSLPDAVTGKDVRLSDSKNTIRVVIFYNHTCTFCRHYEARYRQLAADYSGKAVTFFAIDSTGRSDAAAWQHKKMGFALLRDDRAQIAAALGATAMTTVCIIDARGHLRYRGAFDDSESGKSIRSRFVADAVAALLAGKPMPHEQTDVYGCLIPLPK